MTERYDVSIGRQYEANGQTKTAWTKIGVAFPTKGGGFSVALEALPLPQINDRTGKIETRLFMFPAERGDRQQAPRQQQKASGGGYGDLDSEIPFAPCWQA